MLVKLSIVFIEVVYIVDIFFKFYKKDFGEC